MLMVGRILCFIKGKGFFVGSRIVNFIVLFVLVVRCNEYIFVKIRIVCVSIMLL